MQRLLPHRIEEIEKSHTIGAGIGASNILCQLQLLNTVVIDAGYIIECLADPERKKQRAFCWPDKERFGEE